MVRVRLAGHEYRYEAYQIISLFYDKSDFDFCEEDCDIESLYDTEGSYVECTIYKESANISRRLVVNSESKKSVKNAIKMTLLKCLEEYTGMNMPWGILVGIRPTKIIHEYFRSGFRDEEIIPLLAENYSLSEGKARLALEVASHEKDFLAAEKNSVSVYIGIPFCPTRCVYCSFTSNPIGKNGELVEAYLRSLMQEINTTLKYVNEKDFKIDTLYIGGGTPTSLSSIQMYRLLDCVNSNVALRELREFTVEAGRPDSIDMDKLSVIRDSGCSRISINPQTMNDDTLRKIGRLHTSQDVVDKYYMARDLGFDNINMDTIIGLPGEGEEHVVRTMERLKELSPDNITIHTMALKRASKLNEMEVKVRNRTAESMYNIAAKGARDMGMYPYYMYRQKNMVSPLENVGYCKKGMECIYNIQMIAENISILSFGADAITKLVFQEENRIERAANVKDVREYINRIDEMISNKIEAISLLTK